jgi:hypothetical protein
MQRETGLKIVLAYSRCLRCPLLSMPFGSDDVSACPQRALRNVGIPLAARLAADVEVLPRRQAPGARKAALASICLIDRGEGVILGRRAAADLFENLVLRAGAAASIK